VARGGDALRSLCLADPVFSERYEGWDVLARGTRATVVRTHSRDLGQGIALKVFVMVALVVLVRWTLPRFRFDQLMKLAWRSLIPVTLIMLLLTSFVVALGLPKWTLLLMNIVVFAGMVFIGPLLPAGPNVNRRVALSGSRFSPATN